jgi:hypothetical protein
VQPAPHTRTHRSEYTPDSFCKFFADSLRELVFIACDATLNQSTMGYDVGRRDNSELEQGESAAKGIGRSPVIIQHIKAAADEADDVEGD